MGEAKEKVKRSYTKCIAAVTDSWVWRLMRGKFVGWCRLCHLRSALLMLLWEGGDRFEQPAPLIPLQNHNHE